MRKKSNNDIPEGTIDKDQSSKTKDEVNKMIYAQGYEPRYSGKLRKWFFYKR